MKTKTNRFLSIFMILTILASLLTSLTMTVSAENYPGGTLLYESFTGLVSNDDDATITSPTYQPGENTIVQTKNKNKKVDSGVGLGDYAQQSRSSSNFLATIPASYLKTADETEVAKQGPNAKLTLEFDFKVEGEIPEAANALTAILLGNSSLEGNNKAGRQNSAVAIYLTSPNVVNVYSKAGTYTYYYLPEGVTFDKWHRYQLTVDLTDAESVGSSKYTLTIDGKNVVDADGKEMTSFSNKNMTATEISKLRIDTTKGYDADLDNVSIYKTTETYDSLSTGELMTKLHEVNAKMEGYRAEAEGTEALGNLESAVTAAGTMVTTAFGTYDENGAEVNAAKTQTEVDTVLASLTAAEDALKTYLAGVTYPGGMYFYEPFDGIPKTQPEGTSLSTTDLEGYNPTTTAEEPEQVIEAVTDLPGSTAALKNKANWLNTIVNFPAAYNADGHDGTSAVDAYAKEGKDAKLVIEYDIKTTGNAENAEDGTELFIMVGAKGMTSGAAAREVAAAAYALNLPDSTHTSSYVDAYRKRNSSDEKTGVKFDLTKWQHHKLTIGLTSATAGLARYSLEVDGEVIVQNQQSPGHDSNSTKAYAIEELKMYTINENINVHLANLSVYKVNEDNPAFSPAALSVLLREVDGKMDVYEASGEDLTALNTAYSAAVTALNASYTTAQTDAVMAQEDVDAAIKNLTDAETALKEVLSPYYVSGLITDETTGELTGVTVQEIKEAADATAKMIIATYDENGMVAAQIQAVTAGENTLTSSMDITGKTVKVFIWDMSESTLLDYLADVYTFENVVTE